MNNTDFIEAFGFAAGLLTALTFLPQVIKTWRARSARDVSKNMFLIAAINELMWIAYGVMIKNNVIIITNLVMIVMATTMIYFKIKFDKREQQVSP